METLIPSILQHGGSFSGLLALFVIALRTGDLLLNARDRRAQVAGDAAKTITDSFKASLEGLKQLSLEQTAEIAELRAINVEQTKMINQLKQTVLDHQDLLESYRRCHSLACPFRVSS